MNPKILIVEDEQAIADNIQYALKTEGFETHCLLSGLQVMPLLDREVIDLIILDIGLPDINGLELCKEIRQSHSLPIIFLTARSAEIDRVVGLEIGADDYVVKPFSPRELCARVKAILRRTRPPAGQRPTMQTFQVNESKRQVSYLGQPLELSRYLEGVEEPLVDQANILASMVGSEMEADRFDPANWHRVLDKADSRLLSARIYNLVKTGVDMRIYITDNQGKLIFDSLNKQNIGSDYTYWRDVHLTLNGRYGARTTPDDMEDPASKVLYVAAPVMVDGRMAGVLTVGKPTTSINAFLKNAKPQIFKVGLAAMVAAIVLSYLVSIWITRPIKRLTRYANDVRQGKRFDFPKLDRSEIILRSQIEGSRLKLIVEDRGAGIPEYALGKVFDKFFSLQRPDSREKSTGLGLNFVAEVAKLHGGTVRLENRALKGVRATLTLPLQKPKSEP